MGFTLAVSPLALVGLGLVPLLWGSYTAYELGLYLIYGMVAQGVALCWGRAGFLPLGQALFFGIGAYIAGAALSTFGNGWLVVVLAVIAASLLPALLAGSVGALVFSRQIGSGPYFSLITLALAMLGFQLANSMEEVTGGFNGMTGIPDLLPGVGRFEQLYYVIVAFLGITTLMLGYLLRTPFGQLLSAISQNEERLQFFGFNTSLLKAAAFAISAGIAGFAGALYAPHQGIVTPQAVGFLLSAEFVIWTAVGGRKGLAGPVLGAVAIGFLASALRDDFLYWEVVVAIVFIGVVLRWPSGMAGMVESLWRQAGWMRGAKLPRRRNLSLDARSQERVPDLEFRVVDVRVGSVEILKGFTLLIDSKAIHCVIGPNGAGKTSVLNAMTGKLPVSSGDIRWAGKSLVGRRVNGVAAMGIGRKLQVPSVFPALSIAQNVDIAIWANRIGRLELFKMAPYAWTTPLLDRLEERFAFLVESEQRAGALSVGQRQMLDFSLTMLSEPDLVLLDEPCAGLSVSETAQMTEAISELIAELGATGIIIEHDMEVVDRLSDHVHVLHQGRLLASGTMADVRLNPEVQEVYAGGSKA